MEEELENIIEINDCDCGCGCGEVEVHTDREPDVLLVDEWAEPFENDIIATRKVAEDTLALVTEKSAEIILKENLLLDDMQTVKRELRAGFQETYNKIAAALSSIFQHVTDKTAEIIGRISEATATLRGDISSSTSAIRADIDSLRVAVDLEECSEQDIYEMFSSVEPEPES